MNVGDLVRCKYFHRLGVITSGVSRFPQSARTHVDKIVWVIWCNGKHSKYKVEYLEVINENR